jgi:hypothetical protein
LTVFEKSRLGDDVLDAAQLQGEEIRHFRASARAVLTFP